MPHAAYSIHCAFPDIKKPEPERKDEEKKVEAEKKEEEQQKENS